MKEKIFLLLLLLFVNCNLYAQKDSFAWSGLVLSQNHTPLEFAHVQVISKGKHFIFMTDHKGYVNIRYENYSDTDSLMVSSMGFETKRVLCKSIVESDHIMLASKVYELNEVIIKPGKRITLGNPARSSFRSGQISFNSIGALYIPFDGTKGQIMKVRIYMHDFSQRDWKYRPFRLRLFDGESVVGNELISDTIIAKLGPKSSHWVEIDISHFNVEMPESGVFVAVQGLSKEYYLQNGYIESATIREGKSMRVNSFSIGITKDNRSGQDIRSWHYLSSRYGWFQRTFGNNLYYYYMIQIILEAYE